MKIKHRLPTRWAMFIYQKYIKQMTKTFTKTIIVALAIITNIQISAKNNDWANHTRYAQANKELPLPAKGEKRVVFIGNSITDNWAQMRPEFFEQNNYIGRGISGQTTYQFLLRFRDDVINLKPKLVVITAGTNDCAENTHPFDINRTFGNIVSMIELAKANRIKIVIGSILPASAFKWRKDITDAPDRIMALNDMLRAYAKKHKIPFVDYYSAMVDESGKAMRPELSPDGVHPNDAGYEIMEAMIKPIINKAL